MDSITFLFAIYLRTDSNFSFSYCTFHARSACVYFYPKYKAYRKRNQDLSTIRCISDTLHVGIPEKILCCRKESKSDYNTETTESVLEDSTLKEALVDARSTDDINVI